jgi:CubicO group peptidase (beta-lactamase class C family)
VLALSLALLAPAACTRQHTVAHRGLDAAALTARIDRELSANPAEARLRAIVVLHHGRVVYEHYQQARARDHWNVDGITSTVLATLVGIAIHDGSVPGLGSTLASLLPDRAASMPADVARTTLRQLLTMTAGFDVLANDRSGPFVGSHDPVGDILADQKNPPGRFFDYSDDGAQLIAAVLREATGTSVLAYACAKLFGPLGIDTRPAAEPLGTARVLTARSDRFTWAVDRSGLDDGWGGLKLTARDLSRLGQLFLDEGRWHGRQVVPENWAHVATLTQVSTGYEVAPAYGYGWWVDARDDSGASYGWGYGGQLLDVLPRDDVVVAILTQQDPSNLVRGFFAAELTFLVDEAILPAVRQAGA